MSRTLKILILEDNSGDAGLTLRALRSSGLQFEHRVADNKVDYIVALQTFQPDVILSDHSLPSFTSEEALPIAKDICKTSAFILVTGTVSEEFAVKIIKAGADDYVLKSSLTRLPSAILNAHAKRKAEMENEEHMKKLTAVNKELQTFIYRASHDLRGPLSSMKGLINVARIETEPLQMAKLISLMDSSAEKLDKIVVDLIETLGIRDRSVKREEVDLEAIVTELLASYQAVIKKGNLRISVETEFSTGFFSDGAILKMVLKRVIDNALRFHNYAVPGSYISIRLKTDSDGAFISIADNGTGIKEELQEKVFDMFYRANNESEGSGLGLYLARIGTEKLGGRISLKSIEHIGTTVEITIPS
ncbi:MAG: hybrid sensor histidine kinase/response regulator [Bacteroidetes bacterium]|nr:hybrid sensor histidine kinase/response regulator [Bacteroidota bacterium]